MTEKQVLGMKVAWGRQEENVFIEPGKNQACQLACPGEHFGYDQ